MIARPVRRGGARSTRHKPLRSADYNNAPLVAHLPPVLRQGTVVEFDDKIRSEIGLAVCLRDMGNGTSRIFIDDVKSDKLENPINWKHVYFYTFTPELQNDAIHNMNLTNEQFQNIGVAIIARLLALNGNVK